MPQQEATSQELTAGGGGNVSGSGGQTGTTCTVSGTYVAENKYLRAIIVLAAGEKFPPMTDGKKITWTALTTAIATAKDSDGGLTGVKVEAGAV
jgi:hypothetical protein